MRKKLGRNRSDSTRERYWRPLRLSRSFPRMSFDKICSASPWMQWTQSLRIRHRLYRVELDAESGFDRASWPDEREAQNKLCRCLHWAAVRALWYPWERNKQENQMGRLDLLRGLAYAFLDDYERLRTITNDCGQPASRSCDGMSRIRDFRGRGDSYRSYTITRNPAQECRMPISSAHILVMW